MSDYFIERLKRHIEQFVADPSEKNLAALRTNPRSLESMLAERDAFEADLATKALHRFFPVRVVLREEAGVLQGLIEESFSMDWSVERANIFWSGKAYSIIGEHDLNGPRDAEENVKRLGGKVVDPMDKDCPITVDWLAWFKGRGKFEKRNAPFKVKSRL